MNNKPVLTHKTDRETRQWTEAIGASVLLHIILCAAVILFSHGIPSRNVPMKYIDVDLAMSTTIKKAPAPKPAASPPQNVPVKKKTVTKKKEAKITKPVKKTAPAKKTSISTKKTKKPAKEKPKSIDKALERLEKELAPSPDSKSSAKTEKKTVDPITERLKRMEKETREAPERQVANSGDASDQSSDGSPYEASLIDRYRINVSVEIKDNWAFSKALAAGQTKLETLVSFEVLPDGTIQKVRVLRRSGNDYMDSAATGAILKSSPVRPHPPGINKPFIEIKLRFTPEGLE